MQEEQEDIVQLTLVSQHEELTFINYSIMFSSRLLTVDLVCGDHYKVKYKSKYKALLLYGI